MSLHPEVENYLDKLDKEKKSFDSFNPEYEIANKIDHILIPFIKEGYEPTDEDGAELIAFDFSIERLNKQSIWGTYYGPKFYQEAEEETSQYPGIAKVTPKVLDYWARRANKSQYPILSARYADLVVDFSTKIINKRARPELFQKVIDLNTSICRDSLVSPLNSSIKIRRALDLAISTNDKKRIKEVKKAMITLAEKAAKDMKQARVCYGIFKRLILEDNKKVNLDEKEKTCLVEIVEKILSKGKSYPAILEDTTGLLAEYYSKGKDEDNLIRVLGVYEKSMKAMKYDDSNAVLKSFHYGNIQQLYEKYRDNFKKAGAAANRIIREIEKLDLDWDKSLDQISVETQIDQQTIDNLKKKIFGDANNKKNLQEVILRIAENFVIFKSDIEKGFKKKRQENWLMNLASQQIIAEDNMPVAKLSSEKEDNDRHLIHQASLYWISTQAPFLEIIMAELEQRFSEKQVIKCFKDAESFIGRREDIQLLEKALSKYWDKDYLSASHFLCPLIEAVVRNLAEEADHWTWKRNKDKGFEYRPLGSLLNDKDFFPNINPGICFYLKIVLVESLAMNLRNDWAHGRNKYKFHQRTTSDRLLHVIMVLFWISIKKNKKKTS